LSNLSSVYYKLPEQFVKKVRDHLRDNDQEQQEVGDLLAQD